MTRRGDPRQIVFDHVAEPDAGGSLVAAAHATAGRALVELQGILGEARLNETEVAWLTRGAVATGPDEGASGLSRAPLWGLVRSARAEHPDRALQLVDVDAAACGCGCCWRSCCRRRPSRSWRCGMARCWRHGWRGPERERECFRRRRQRRITALRSPDPGRLDGVSLVAAPSCRSHCHRVISGSACGGRDELP